MVDLVKLIINGKEVEAPVGSTILQAAEMAGVEIPRLCYDKDLSPLGACRLCVVEVKGNRLLPAACVTPVYQGMEVDTDSPAVVEARKTILELLIANHPLDCLTCEKAGACKLQDYCYRYGVKESPFAGEKHDYAIDDSNPFIVRDLNKCILCGACVRACEELTGADNLSYLNRGFHRKATTAGDVDYIDSDCVFCGQCVAVCPTGALTELQKTIVFVTHDISEAVRLGDRMLVMKDGESVQEGQPQDIILNPVDDYVQKFVQDEQKIALMLEKLDKKSKIRVLDTHSTEKANRNKAKAGRA